jgi:hypothetical protein
MTLPRAIPPLVAGCGILQKEIRFLIQKNGWPLETFFLDSSLHIDYDRLSRGLKSVLDRHANRDLTVFYGACHPLMDRIIGAAGVTRTHGQNCVEMLLGHEAFTHELEGGAFFLLEEWAWRWEEIVTATLGTNLKVIRDIYQSDRNVLLCLRTPCSGNFEAEAEEAGRLVGLPLRWMDVPLDHLEAVLQEAVAKRRREA